MCQEVCQEHFRQREEQVQNCRNVKLHDIFTEGELCRKRLVTSWELSKTKLEWQIETAKALKTF